MIPDQFITFFAASLTADGALIGLLFVAIAIEPEHVFGEQNQERALAANGAFTSLVNAFLISMLALVPGVNLGWATIVIAVISLLSVIVHALDKLRRGQRTFNRSLFYTLGGLALYSMEIVYSIQLIQQPRNSLDALYGLLYVLVAVYGVALARAWSLLGGENRLITRILTDAIRRRTARAQPTASAAPANLTKPDEKSVPPV